MAITHEALVRLFKKRIEYNILEQEYHFVGLHVQLEALLCRNQYVEEEKKC